MAPWGKPIPAGQGRRTNGVGGGNRSRVTVRGSSTRRPTPSKALWSISYPANDPTQWPVEGGKNTSSFTQEKADWNNAVVNHAFQRAGYAG
jgi:hypothetical protein